MSDLHDKSIDPTVAAAAAATLKKQRRSRLTNKSRLYATLLLLLMPTLVGMVLFNYYPKWEAIKYSLFRWDGSTIEEFRWFDNFIKIFTGDVLFWKTFKLIGILLAANAVKFWPCVLTAIALHRLKSEKAQYVYRVLFVIPMVIPGLVWLLIWKSFYNPTVGILNTILNVTGLMRVLEWLDIALPKLGNIVRPISEVTIDPVFGSVWGLGLLGIIAFSLIGGLGGIKKGWMWWIILLAAGLGLWGWERTLITLAIVAPATHMLSRSFGGRDAIKWFGWACTIIAVLFVLTSVVWTEPTNGLGQRSAFAGGSPAWLGHSKLVIPALVFWGFPFVGTIGVLIYLAGLQNISQDVYEAGELDGVGPIGKLFRIELPLILAQVRINLIFMTIGTLNDYGLILILLGPDGGPGNVGMTPGLYMYRVAFQESRYGYACALGMVLFVMILTITILYQKYVKVEK